MEIMKVKNYKTFAEMLKRKTGCEINIKLMSKNHIHYQLSKDGLSIGILCIDEGEVSFAPFSTHENVNNEQYINVQYMPLLDDFISVLKVFQELFVCELETNI